MEWRVGVAKAKITPDRPLMMGGFASRREPFRGVVHDLWVKAMTIEDHTGNLGVIITCDFIGFRAVNANSIAEELMQKTGLRRDQILLNSSHTHTGPSQAESPDQASYLSADQVRDLFEYTQWLKATVVETAMASMRPRIPARLAHDTGVAPFVMNRREPTAAGIILGHNPRGPADRSVPVLRVTRPDGSLLGLVFGTACHNTTIPAKENEICGDFAGFAQIGIEQRYPGVQAMFMQGCGGDAGPYPTGSLAWSERHGRTLADEVSRLLKEDDFSTISGPLKTGYESVDLPLQPPMSLAQIEELEKGPAQWRRWVGARMRERYETQAPWPTHYSAPLSAWQFGDDLTLVGLSGEVVVDYVALLEAAVGPLNLWIAAYCNDVFGYLPSARVLAEGGYETRGLYSGELFSPEVQTVVVDQVEALVRQVGRPMP